MARDAPTCHLVAISTISLGLSLPEGLLTVLSCAVSVILRLTDAVL